jgi:hypothetical protein
VRPIGTDADALGVSFRVHDLATRLGLKSQERTIE